jgi:enamine deaminase RidA (YjgF/YER057c/UK114 family)
MPGRPAISPGGGDELAEAPPGDTQLREQVEQAWADISAIVDRIIGSGRMLDRDLLLDMARFLESAMPAVGAYERLVARAYQDAVAQAGVTALPLRVAE